MLWHEVTHYQSPCHLDKWKIFPHATLAVIIHFNSENTYFYVSVPVTAVAPGCMFSGCPSKSGVLDISEMPQGNFFQFGTNVHLDSRMNWLDFRGQRSRLLWPHKTRFLAITQELIYKLRQSFTEMSNRIKWWSGDILYWKGQRSTSLSHHSILQKHFSGHYSQP